MIEKLTDEERAALQRRDVCYSPPIPLCEKALRIIDAQAAVIEKLRALASSMRVTIPCSNEIIKALAAAPKPTAPEDTSDVALIDGLSDSLTAAKDRVAELEREGMAAHDAYNEALHREAAANARADAAERNHQRWAIEHARVERAESEAAALRAVIERVRALTEREPAVVYTREIREALAAAPEPTATTYVEGRPGHAGYDIQAAPEPTVPEKLGQDVREMLAAANAKCDAQAAVIERVRDLYDALPQYPEREALLEFAERTIETLAAASEHTGPDVYPPGKRGSSANTELGRVQRERDAANARVAELELAVLDYANRADVANVRADAAEQKFTIEERERIETERLLENVMHQLDAAESEAASLRAEVARCERSLSERTEQREKAIDSADAAERELHKRTTAEYSAANTRACSEDESESAALRAELDKANAKYVDARDRCIAAQDESVALRAEVERLRDALQWVVNTLDEDYPMTASQIRKVLSTAPAPTGREAAALRADSSIGRLAMLVDWGAVDAMLLCLDYAPPWGLIQLMHGVRERIAKEQRVQ